MQHALFCALVLSLVITNDEHHQGINYFTLVEFSCKYLRTPDVNKQKKHVEAAAWKHA
jgi:hypothetical protein